MLNPVRFLLKPLPIVIPNPAARFWQTGVRDLLFFLSEPLFGRHRENDSRANLTFADLLLLRRRIPCYTIPPRNHKT